MTPLRLIAGINVFILLLVYAVASLPGIDQTPKIVALFAPFILSMLDLVLGILCIIRMNGLRRTDPPAAVLADKAMQAFMISCAATFTFGIPACLFGLSHL